jgi:PAS domain S-box-containing protein
VDVTGLPLDSLDGRAIDALPVAVCVFDGDARLLSSSQGARELWGGEPSAEEFRESPLAEVLRTGQPVRDAAFVVRRRDGSAIPTHLSIAPIANADGSVLAAVLTCVENRLDSAADLYRAQLAAIVVSSDDAIVSKTLDGIITSWNAGAERVFGYSAEEAVGKHISLIIPADRLAEEFEVLARLRRGEKIDHFETVRQTKDGRLVDISLTVSPIRSSDGRVIGASKVARDVTERRLAQEAVSLSRRRYKRIFESAGVSIWEEDFTAVRAGLDALRESGVRDFAAYFRERPEEVDRFIGLVRIVDVNETTLHMFGAPDKTFVLESLATIFTGRAKKVFGEELVALAEGRTRFEAETVLRTARGEEFDGLVSINFPLPGEPVDSVLVTLTDMTVQKRVEQARRDSESLFHEMADKAPAMLWMSDAAGAWTFLSRQWYDMTGQEAESALGLGWLGAVHPDDRDSAADTFYEATRQGRQFHFECRLVQAPDEFRWAIIAGQPRVGDDGAFLGFVGSAIDITERRKAEEAVIDEIHTRETLSRVGAALASELDPDTLIQAAIDAATALTSAQWGTFFYTTADESGDVLHYAVAGVPKNAFAGSAGEPSGTGVRDTSITRVDDLLADGTYDSNELDRRWLPRDLPVRSYLAVPVVSRMGEVRGGLCFGHARPGVFRPKHEQLASGIAAWTALALDNARLYREAQDASRAKDEFMATLSHELRTPLNAMLGWAHMLRSNVLPPETHRRALDTLERNVRTQAQLVDDLLDVSRIIAGKLQIKGDDVDLTTMVISAADTIRPAAAAKGLALRLAVDPDRQVIVTGDADRLRQVLWNLLTNAVKFTPNHGRIDVELRCVDSSASIVIADSGQGIRHDFLQHVFERFRQADSTTARRHGGLGLGLAIVRHLTEAHGGSVSAESAGEGLGSTFTVLLPVKAVRRRVDAGAAEEPRVRALAGLQVLLVDDEPDTREVLRTLLEIQGASVRVAASAGEALDLIQSCRADVLLADIGMPEQDGYSLIEAVRALKTPEALVPAVAVTAYVSSRDRARAFNAGYGWHLAKPVDPEQLVAVVSAAVGNRAPTRAS